jgi:hypothetical protein
MNPTVNTFTHIYEINLPLLYARRIRTSIGGDMMKTTHLVYDHQLLNFFPQVRFNNLSSEFKHVLAHSASRKILDEPARISP